MKVIFVAVVLVLALAGGALAGGQVNQGYNGSVLCKPYKRDGFTCLEMDYLWGVGISGDFVFVQNPQGRTVYKKIYGG